MTNRRPLGFTLIELVIFIVIVSIAVASVLLVMNTVVKSSAAPIVNKQAAALADSILEEILLKKYTDPDGNEFEENGRDDYDDVDDFNGKTNSLFTDLPSELSAYVISIAVAAPAALNGIPMKKVTVTVTNGADSISIEGYRGNY